MKQCIRDHKVFTCQHSWAQVLKATMSKGIIEVAEDTNEIMRGWREALAEVGEELVGREAEWREREAQWTAMDRERSRQQEDMEAQLREIAFEKDRDIRDERDRVTAWLESEKARVAKAADDATRSEAEWQDAAMLTLTREKETAAHRHAKDVEDVMEGHAKHVRDLVEEHEREKEMMIIAEADLRAEMMRMRYSAPVLAPTWRLPLLHLPRPLLPASEPDASLGSLFAAYVCA